VKAKKATERIKEKERLMVISSQMLYEATEKKKRGLGGCERVGYVDAYRVVLEVTRDDF